MTDEKETVLLSIRSAEDRLTKRFANALEVNHSLDRMLVSYQANKLASGHRWHKYKEAFSAPLVRYVLNKLDVTSGQILDPFAGSGTTLFTASDLGLDSVGIELLPNSIEAIGVRKILRHLPAAPTAAAIRAFSASLIWQSPGPARRFPHLRITAGAFPQENEAQLGRYLYKVDQICDGNLRRILSFAALCVLESISYTRQDGQYLRWDARSGRRVGKKPFCKGPIIEFTRAITDKLEQIAADIDCPGLPFGNGASTGPTGTIDLRMGSCFDVLPKLATGAFDGLVTSPPYCNRYDYTRTYALELAMLDVNEAQIRSLRQAMLSCTVENRDKNGLFSGGQGERFQKAAEAFESQELLRSVVDYLELCRAQGAINNSGIPRMVRNYFRELAVVIFECARVLKPGAPFVMVNDNVRYQGVRIPVDLILTDIAEQAGFRTEKIWVLPRGKGNSSQQMGRHGREELRKCVIVWRRR